MGLAILLIVIAVAIGVPIGLKRAKQQREDMANGKIVKRPYEYFKNAEIFTADITDQQAFQDALTSAVRATGYCSFSGNYSSSVEFRGAGNAWKAALICKENNGNHVVYYMGLTHYEHSNRGGSIGIISLQYNYVLTAVEKTFLQFDPKTQVTLEAIDFKTKTKLF